MKKTSLLYLFLFFSLNCFAQLSKTHYIPPLSGTDYEVVQGHYLYISTPSTTPVNVNIIAIGGGTTSVTVTNNSPKEYYINSGNDTQLMASGSNLNKPISNKGFIIEANNLVYVAVRVISGNNNQAGSLTSKGMSALGKEFRVGAFINTGISGSSNLRYTFLSILATENNTKIEFKDIKPGVTLVNNSGVGNTPASIVLNRGESYVLATEDNNIANKDGLIGALVKSDKPIAFNCGSFSGTNGNTSNRDLGFDQIVPMEKIISGLAPNSSGDIETEYIFVRGAAPSTLDIIERPLIVAHHDGTNIYINGNTIPITINAGEYYIINGSDFGTDKNIYVRTSKPVFAYQSVGGASQANQQLFFVPPLNCSTPNFVNNIPFIENVGNLPFTTNSGLNIVTKTGANLQIGINGINYSSNSLPSGITISSNIVTTKNSYTTYRITGLKGNIGVFSDQQVYVSYFGSNGAATYGGYYSGFDIKPEITSDKLVATSSSCIPNALLKASTASIYNSFEWFLNDSTIPIAGENSNFYNPTQPGFYKVKVSNSNCGSFTFSDNIPISNCPSDIDNDLIADNIDLDNDNDGISNCTESYGDQSINISNLSSGNLTIGNYNNSFIETITTTGNASSTPFTGKTDGSFISEIPAGIGNSETYTITFDKPISLSMNYVTTASPNDLLNSEAEYTVNSDLDKTITILNPNNQLLIDTNYDGVYESGVTQFSSFEIRFRLNSTIPLAAGTGNFKLLTNLTKSLRFTHKNLSDTNTNKSTFKIMATCIPRDTDLDGIADQLDLDSDNDGIPDNSEAEGKNSVSLLKEDTNKDGLYDIYGSGINCIDSDSDGVKDYLDLDSDNDGIYDLVESGNNAADINLDGVVDGLPTSFGTNGLSDSIETSADSQVINYTIADTDGDGIRNYIELDSDNDLCNDVIEAGFLDPNSDGLLGNNPLTVDTNGIVTSGTAYTNPGVNYITTAPIIITTQPIVTPSCELQNTTISLVDNGGNTYQWQVYNGSNWADITNNSTYSGATSNTLSITNVSQTMNGYKYRVQLNKIGNSCGLISAETTLTVYQLPIVKDVTIVQCDSDSNPDGKTFFNLTVNNDLISSNYINENFTYYTSPTGANSGLTTDLIVNDLAFENTSASLMYVWARITDKITGCFSVAKLTLKVPATNLLPSYKIPIPTVCDDFLDTNGINNSNNNNRDGIATFDFSWTKATILSMLPTNQVYTINYYRNKSDALAEINLITDISNYRNIGYPNYQDIWVRVESKLDNTCVGLGPYITLKVEALPFANPVIIPRQCDDNQDGIYNFDTSILESTLLNGQTNVTVTYFDQNNMPLKDANGIAITSPFPPNFKSKSQTIKAVVTNNSTLGCFDETLILFTVDDLPEAFSIPAALTSACDDELDPLDQDGKFAFDTTTIQTTILGTQSGLIVKYYDENGNTLASPLPNPFITGTQNVTATVINPLNLSCTATTTIHFVVNALPKINLNTNGSENELICSNIPTFFVNLDAGIQDGSPTNYYTYIWSKDGTIMPTETNYNLNVNSNGDYLVKVTTAAGCNRTRSINVTSSDIATINSIDITDLSDVNSITIHASGKGNYEFSLDAPFGPFQTSNLFENVAAGIHDVYVIDTNGCGTVTKQIAVIGVPKFFTPNGDGYNDYWNVKGVNNIFNSKSIIYIFDRYGKLLKQILPSSQGWDGTINGSPMPADDYWYSVQLEDGRETKGHFSLKR